jgi:hypothetical protein
MLQLATSGSQHEESARESEAEQPGQKLDLSHALL